jgi:hypothetical protein
MTNDREERPVDGRPAQTHDRGVNAQALRPPATDRVRPLGRP